MLNTPLPGTVLTVPHGGGAYCPSHMVSDCGSAVEVTTDNPKVTELVVGDAMVPWRVCAHMECRARGSVGSGICSTPHCQAQYSPYLTVGVPIVHLNRNYQQHRVCAFLEPQQPKLYCLRWELLTS